MKSINDGPGQKQGQNKSNTSKTADNEKSSNKGKDATGPNWDKKSKGGEGDTGQNAGVFK
jgi:hypothetical protein